MTTYTFVDQGATIGPLDFPRYPTRSAARRLARFKTPTAAGTNVFILTDDSVTTRQPPHQSDISRTLYGGHDVPTDLTAAEITLLVNANMIVAV